MKLRFFDNIKHFYFIGIGGISMSGLAKYLNMIGYKVSGSDVLYNECMHELKRLGVEIYTCHNKNNIKDADVVVYNSAIGPDNEEYAEAVNSGKFMLSRVELLNIVCSDFDNVISIAGSHGKTTATAMIAHIFKTAKAEFTAHIGGEDTELGNFYYKGNSYFITEACEYKKNLLHINSDVALLLNCDKDHLECYSSEDELLNTFERYCKNAKKCIINEDEKRLKLDNAITFGLDKADFKAYDIKQTKESYSFSVSEYGKFLCKIKLKTVGFHNIYNALGAIAVARTFGLDPLSITSGLANFKSVKRRFEKIGLKRGVNFICDYAHHPKEIEAVVNTARKITKNKLFVVFQPHTYSRTKLLKKEFISVLQNIENLVIFKTFPAREYFDVEGSALALHEDLSNSIYAESLNEISAYLTVNISKGDTVLFLGAGDIYYLAIQLVKNNLKQT